MENRKQQRNQLYQKLTICTDQQCCKPLATLIKKKKKEYLKNSDMENRPSLLTLQKREKTHKGQY